MACLGEQALVLVLATELNAGSDALRQLAHRRHGAVDLNASATARLYAAAHDRPICAFTRQEKATFHDKRISPFAHLSHIGALPRQELDRREQGRFASACLPRQYRKPRGGRERRVLYERDIMDMQLVYHFPASP